MDGNGGRRLRRIASIPYRITACTLLWSVLQISTAAEARYVRSEDCTWEPVSESSGVSITCSLSTLQAGLDPTNFSLIMPAHTVRLAIRCSEGQRDSHVGELANGSFEHLHSLQTLTLERCRLGRLPSHVFRGLAALKELTLKTFNSNLPLRIIPTSLLPLVGLQSLDLSENSIESLPHALLCGLGQLEFLNLTANKFSDVVNMGLSSESRCPSSVRTLEVAYNQLTALSDRGFASLPRLEKLQIDHNRLARTEPSALDGLANLHSLDMAHNQLVALPATLFRATPNLEELYLRDNSLSALPPDLFVGLNKLTILDLAHNQLSSLEWLGSLDGAATLASLSLLDLSNNQLTRLEHNALRSLSGLQTLNLQANLIEYIADGVFAHLENLQSLTLTNNRLAYLGARTFIGLGNSLGTLLLDKNRLEGMHNDSFKDISMLQELNLSGNRLSSVPRALSTLAMLRSLDLSENNLQDVVNASYQDLHKLYALNLMANQIGNISQGAFSGLPSVRILNLARNGIQAVEEGAFDDLPGLHYLRLDSNAIENVNGLFSNLHDLIMLNISCNRVRWFDYALIPVGLQWLDIHDNQIEALGNYFEMEQNLKLRTLDASYNRLTDLDSSSLPNGIEIVFLKHNNLRRIQPFTFLGKQNLTRVDLTNNLLRVLEMTTFRLSEVSVRRPLPEFAIAGNPYLCDCRLEWLRRLPNRSEADANDQRQYPRVVDLQAVECSVGFSKNVAPTKILVNVEPNEFLCEYKSHCFPMCNCCDFDGCDCEMACPANCTCYHDEAWNTNIVDCSSRNRTASPAQLPWTANTLYLDGNDIRSLGPVSLGARASRLEVLFANNSNIASIQNRTFTGLRRLRVLRLENNLLSSLENHLFDGLSALEELHLFNNRLNRVGETTFAHLPSLRIITLNRNNLLEISFSTLTANAALSEIRLAGNPWTCECRFTKQLGLFLRSRGDTVRDIFQLTCAFNETSLMSLWELNVTQTCLKSPQGTPKPQFQLRRIDEFLSPFVVVAAVSILLIAALTITVVLYRRRVSVWFFSRFGVRMFQRTPIEEEEKLFDAFVSYSKKDEAFVAQILAPELECGNPPYRLCLHYRDLPMAGTYLSEAIQEAVESSRRTIVVLSEHFLKSDWCRYEFKSAHHEVLQNTNHKVVVIFFGKVSYRELDPDIRMWLKHSTFLHWGEKNFWDKLRYSMPDARCRSKVMRSDLASVAVHI